MNIFTKMLKQDLIDMNIVPIYKGSDCFIFQGQVIDISKITNNCDLIYAFFKAGERAKINELKDVLNIGDPK